MNCERGVDRHTVGIVRPMLTLLHNMAKYKHECSGIDCDDHKVGEQSAVISKTI